MTSSMTSRGTMKATLRQFALTLALAAAATGCSAARPAPQRPMSRAAASAAIAAVGAVLMLYGTDDEPEQCIDDGVLYECQRSAAEDLAHGAATVVGGALVVTGLVGLTQEAVKAVKPGSRSKTPASGR
jgi:hypothetical protein